MVIFLEKKVGETPLAAMEAYRAEHAELAGVPMTCAGRLDPMASGVLLVLIGDECKDRKKYDGLDKEYEFEVLLGFKTDTGDVLGLVEQSDIPTIPTEEEVCNVAVSFVGTHAWPYPAFSSKTVGGKPLFQYALEKKLATIAIPTIESTIHELAFLGMECVDAGKAVSQIIQKIGLLHTDPNDTRLGSDFRKKEIIERWLMYANTNLSCVLLKFRVRVSAGTYIRTLAPLIAAKLGTCGLAYSIHRTKVVLP